MASEPSFNSLERAVLELLLAGEDPVLLVLRTQLSMCSLGRRELTGGGFFSSLIVAPKCPRTPKLNFQFGDVVAKVDGLKHGAGFLLFIRDGLLGMLEGYAYDETWPENIAWFRVGYDKEPRDLCDLRKEWEGTK